MSPCSVRWWHGAGVRWLVRVAFLTAPAWFGFLGGWLAAAGGGAPAPHGLVVVLVGCVSLSVLTLWLAGTLLAARWRLLDDAVQLYREARQRWVEAGPPRLPVVPAEEPPQQELVQALHRVRRYVSVLDGVAEAYPAASRVGRRCRRLLTLIDDRAERAAALALRLRRLLDRRAARRHG